MRMTPSVGPIFARLIRVSGKMRGPMRASCARAAASPASSARSSKSSRGASMLASILVLLVDANPLSALYYFLLDPLSKRTSAIEVLVKATPLLLTGAAVTFAFAGGYYNIGAEGQLYAGAVAATAVGLQMDGMPKFVAIPAILLAGFAAGMLWALTPALLKIKLAIDEVVTTLLLNSVALFCVSALLNGPWRNPVSQWPQSPDIAASAVLPKLLAQ